jgi:predicted Zn-dependent peptidase
VIDKKGSVQTEIRVGQLAIPRKHDDYEAVSQAVKILGGEGANRLQQVLRSQRQLTYGASADLESYKLTGAVVAETDTQTKNTAEALRVTVDEFSRLQRERVADEELQGAQDYMVGHFPLTIEVPTRLRRRCSTSSSTTCRSATCRSSVSAPCGDAGGHRTRGALVHSPRTVCRSCSSAMPTDSSRISKASASATSSAFPSSRWT